MLTFTGIEDWLRRLLEESKRFTGHILGDNNQQVTNTRQQVFIRSFSRAQTYTNDLINPILVIPLPVIPLSRSVLYEPTPPLRHDIAEIFFPFCLVV